MENAAQKNIINTLYGFLILSTILGFVPHSGAFIASLVLWTVALVAAYLYRCKDKDDGLLYNHMTYLIGTIWIGTTLIVLGTIIAGLWVYYYGDNSPLDDAVAAVSQGAVPDEAMLRQIMGAYFHANKGLLITASSVAIGPAILYFVYRVANGLGRAAKGYRLANPRSWL